MYFLALILSAILFALCLMAICNSSKFIQTLLAILSIIGSIIILLAIVGDILAFNNNKDATTLLDGLISNRSFGIGFGLAIVAFVFTIIMIPLFFKSRYITIKIKV